MSFRLYNTLTRQKELFEPVTPGKAGIYVCGPTVYKESHIGHAVGPVIFDALKKYLTFKNFEVKLIINITDVDDKILIEAARLKIDPADLARQVSQSYFQALEALGVDSIDQFPRATEHIEHIIEMIQKIAERGAAYQVGGDVYFDVSKSSDYGKLSNRRSEDQLEGSRQLSGAEKRNAADFALWKAVPPDELGWDSPWGRGRPGWHIECSAMSMNYLGETFDIHGGGMDLIFPHHENEIAQSETATGKPFAKYWMHNGLTRVRTKAAGSEWKTEKMSKSLGNIKPIRELLQEYPAPVLRFFLLSTHYRRPIDFSDDAIQSVQKGLLGIYRLLDRAARITAQDVFTGRCNAARLEELAQDPADLDLKNTVLQSQLRYLEDLDDDFNTAGALSVLFDLCGALNRYIDQQNLEMYPADGKISILLEGARMLTSLGRILGLLTAPLPVQSPEQDALAGQLMNVLIDLRAEAKKSKNFALADSIRDKLKALHITLEDRPGGKTLWLRENP